MGASHTHETSVTLLGKVIGVTAFYQITGERATGYIPEIETVQADYGEITHILALPSLRRYPYTEHMLYVRHVVTKEWTDPIRAALFGSLMPWSSPPAFSPTRPKFDSASPTWLEIIEAEIRSSDTFRLICDEDSCEGLD